jgi:murein DD-endopeptidase MepM/ murein hydrolase activator NlpD
MRFTPTKKISELEALSPATLDTTFVVGISGSTTYKISINQLTSSLDGAFATDLVTNALSNSLDTKLATTIFNTNSSSFHSRINAVSSSVSAGTSGTSGTSGAQGNQGPIGPQGINGTAGSSGVQGPQGNQGVNGSNGTSGTGGTSTNIKPQVANKKFSCIKPVKGGTVVADYGVKGDRWNGGIHKALDWSVPEGTPVVAAHDGVVHTFDNLQSEVGRYIRLWYTGAGQDRTFSTGYAHLSSFAVGDGTAVKQGDLIGYSGRTGTNCDGAHLHFEVLKNFHF